MRIFVFEVISCYLIDQNASLLAFHAHECSWHRILWMYANTLLERLYTSRFLIPIVHIRIISLILHNTTVATVSWEYLNGTMRVLYRYSDRSYAHAVAAEYLHSTIKIEGYCTLKVHLMCSNHSGTVLHKAYVADQKESVCVAEWWH